MDDVSLAPAAGEPMPAVYRSAAAALDRSAVTPPPPRDFAGVNWIGLQTLYLREVRRFLKVGAQTLAAPVVTALLYMLVFVVAVRGAAPPIEGVRFATFVAPGLIMMQILSNAFANSSSSLLQAKMMGLLADFITPPLSPLEQVIGFAAGAATRGVAVGVITGLAILPFAPMPLAHLWAVLYFGIGASLIMAMVGLMGAIWAVKFDHIAAVGNFVIMPMTFLSGTFYLVSRLPEPFRSASHYNPFFYLISGFRYGFIGRMDGSLAIGVTLTAVLVALLTGVCLWMFQTGYRMKT